MAADNAVDVKLLKEAADWAILLQYEAPDEPQRQAFARWLAASPAHAAAWAKAQSVFATFSQVPGHVTRETVQQLQRGAERRRSMRLLGIALLGLPAVWLAWRQLPVDVWSADLKTATGERKTITLPDGTVLVLNTASAVNIAFDADARRIRLIAGEILVTTHADPSPVYRPFLVDTPRGVVQALGTRFMVRQLDSDAYRVGVLEHAVEIRPLFGPSRVLQAGQQADFGASGTGPVAAVDSSAALWERGMLLARDMRLGEVVAELARYRTGVLRCAPDVANLRVSGAISLVDTEAALLALAGSLPLSIDRHTRYWVTVNGKR